MATTAGATAATGDHRHGVAGAHPGPRRRAPSTPPTAARFVVSGPNDHDRVALTFHTNGDLGLVDELLGVLAARRVHVTMFIVGNWLDANPDMAARIAAGGHEFANHTYTHPTFGDLSRDAMLDEIVRCRDVLVRLTGGPGAFFRPSGTDDGTTSPERAGARRRRATPGTAPSSASTSIRSTTTTPGPTSSCSARSPRSRPDPS